MPTLDKDNDCYDLVHSVCDYVYRYSPRRSITLGHMSSIVKEYVNKDARTPKQLAAKEISEKAREATARNGFDLTPAIIRQFLRSTIRRYDGYRVGDYVMSLDASTRSDPGITVKVYDCEPCYSQSSP